MTATDTPGEETPETVATVAVIGSFAGQAALFDDPRRLLALPINDLRKVAAEAAREGRPIFAHLRRVFGLVAWAMWNQSSELTYGQWEIDYAAELSVAPTTLRRWRRDVVEAEDLPVPSVAAMRAVAATSSRKAAGQTASATKNGSTIGAPKIQPGSPPTPSAPPLPDPGPPPTLRASIAHLIDHLHSLDPTETGAAMTAAQLDLLMEWTERAVAAKPRKTRGSARQTAASARQKTAAPADSDCPHPINRRIGSGCGACGATVK